MSLLRPGQTFLQRYEIVRLIERQEDRLRYEGFDAAIARRVVIAVLVPDEGEGYSAQRRQLFHEEATARARAHDRHACALLDYGMSPDERLYLVTALAEDASNIGGGTRELSPGDFAAAPGVELSLSDPVEHVDVPRRRSPAGPSPSVPAAREKKGGGTLGFAIVLTLLLSLGSVALVDHLGLELPWVEQEPLRAASLAVKTFALDDPDTASFYVDFERGMVVAPDPEQLAAEGRCALVLESRRDPSPRGIFYFADVVDFPEGPVTARPMERDALIDRVALCADAGMAAWDVVQTAEILGARIRIGKLEAKSDARERTERVEAKRKRRVRRGEGRKKKLLELLIERGTGIPIDLLSK